MSTARSWDGLALLLTLSLACGTPAPEPPAAPEPVSELGAPPPDVVVEHVWVHASSLRLRPEPRGDTAFTTLAINSRLRVLERKEGWVRVTAPDSREGWVHGDFVGTARLTVQDVERGLAEATTDEERLALWQRAAALEPTDPAVLQGLAGAYRALGVEAEAAGVERVLAEGAESFDAWFPGQKDEVDAITAALPGARDADSLIGLWKRAVEVTAAMAEPLNARYDDERGVFPSVDLDALLMQRMPWSYWTSHAEGTWAALELKSTFWAEAAANTPEPWDDRFIDLQVVTYGNACGRGWAAWQDREWDYGGCSPFGSGRQVHLDLLTRCDELARQALVADEVAEIRARVLADIRQEHGPGEFPYCTTMGELTPVAGLAGEAQAILDQVQLSADERAMIRRRIDEGFAPRE